MPLPPSSSLLSVFPGVGPGVNTEKFGGGIAAAPEFFVTGVAPIIMFIGGPVGGIPDGSRLIPAGVLRMGTLRPAGAINAARGSSLGAGVAGAGVEGATAIVVGGGGATLAFAKAAGSSWPSTNHTLNSCE